MIFRALSKRFHGVSRCASSSTHTLSIIGRGQRMHFHQCMYFSSDDKPKQPVAKVTPPESNYDEEEENRQEFLEMSTISSTDGSLSNLSSPFVSTQQIF